MLDHGACNFKQTDYAVFRLSPGAAKEEFVHLTLGRARQGSNVALAHHPDGAPKKISFGQIQGVSDNHYDYTAHTLGGSSGAPVGHEIH